MKSPNILLSIIAAVAMTFGLSTSSVQGGAGGTCASDITGDRQINGADLAQLLADWGQCPAVVPAWATLLEAVPNPAVVTDANLRAAIVASGFAWRIRDNSSNIEMLLVPAGTFTMGCSPGDANCLADESPAHQVTLTNAFYMGKTEVTQAQWQATMGINPSYFFGQPNNPVERVSWNTIQSFNSANGLRLPTEAEWEYACRAATTTARYGVLNDIAWYNGNAGGTTHAVGAFLSPKLPNALGLYDTLGNVWEWCQDWYEPYSLGSVTNPTGPATGSYRLLRGGSWDSASSDCRGSRRYGYNPDVAVYDLGFRAVRGVRGAGGTCASDINGDRQINGADLAQLLADWGQCPVVVPAWATLLEAAPNPAVVTDANLRAAIVASGFAWRIRDNSSNIEMLLVPGGTFMMGCSPGDAECYSDESPAHEVTLTNAFYMGKTEVTQAQWQATMGSNPSHFVAGNGFPGSFDHPVEQVSWNMIQGFNTATGLRLPTEAEWEYACRAATTTARYGVLNDIAWYNGNAGGTTHAVATKLPNALGLYDTLGNVWEWCQDWKGYYSSASVINPTGPATGSYRLLRGGGWGYLSYNCRASRRIGSTPGSLDYLIGFRVVRTP